MILDSLTNVLIKNSLIVAFAFVGILVWVSYLISAKLTRGHVHGSAIAIALGLVLAYVGGAVTGGSQGLADFSLLAGVGVMGGAMFRDFAIVATAFGAELFNRRDGSSSRARTGIRPIVNRLNDSRLDASRR